MPRKRKAEMLKGYVLGALFFEPSTRTRLSFEAAAAKLGMNVVGFSGTSDSSIAKGETLRDTIRTVANYADVIVMRHNEKGIAEKCTEYCSVPLINGGDGSNEHPTQALLDLYTIKKEFGKLDGLKIGCIGGLKYYRATNSLIRAMSHFSPEFYFISPKELRVRKEFTDELKAKGIKFTETENLQDVIRELDVLYVTRLAKEYFPNINEYNKHKGSYVIGRKTIETGKKTLRVMHPLPRVDEIKEEVDSMKQAVYFKQAANGIPVRQAVLCSLLGKKV